MSILDNTKLNFSEDKIKSLLLMIEGAAQESGYTGDTLSLRRVDFFVQNDEGDECVLSLKSEDYQDLEESDEEEEEEFEYTGPCACGRLTFEECEEGGCLAEEEDL